MPTSPDPTAAATGSNKWRAVPLIALWLILITTLIVIGNNLDTKKDSTALTYSEFLAKADTGDIKTASIDPEGKVQGDLTNGESYKTQIPTAVVGEELGQRLEAK